MICKPCTEGEHAYCEYPPSQTEIDAHVDELLCAGFHREYRGKGCTCEHRLANGTVETGTTKAVRHVEPATGPAGE